MIASGRVFDMLVMVIASRLVPIASSAAVPSVAASSAAGAADCVSPVVGFLTSGH